MKYCPPLSPEQQQLVEDNLSIAYWTVQRYIAINESVAGLSWDDLCQEASVALCKAATTYTGHQVKFKTYAITVIRNHLIDYCRRITADNQHLPRISLDATGIDGELPPLSDTVRCSGSTFEDDSLSKMSTGDFLKRRKQSYHGTAKLGVEALELKVLGDYSITDIAALYGVKPNLVGARISKATKKIREDITAAELSFLRNGASALVA